MHDPILIVIISLFFRKVRNTSFTVIIKVVFPQYLFFIFFKVIKKNFIVFNKICYIYQAVQQQLWSNTHQLVKIFIITDCLLFYFTLSIYPIFKSMGKFFFYIILSCLQKLTFQAYIFFFLHRFWNSFQVFRYCFRRRYISLAGNVLNKICLISIISWILTFLNKKLFHQCSSSVHSLLQLYE